MRAAHTVAQVRAAEAERLAELPDGALMERAAFGLATRVIDFLGGSYGRRVLVIAGSGNNGGDARIAGAVLARRGAVVRVVDSAATDHLPPADWPEVVLDGIVGIGGAGPLRPEAAALVERYRRAPWVAVDLPSGVDPDTGEIQGPHVRAALTVTMGTYKVAQLVDPGAGACGVLDLVDLGLSLPPAEVESWGAPDVARVVPFPASDSHKYTRGVVGLRTGSAQYPGAAALSVSGALSGLAGMVRYDGSAASAVVAEFPEVVAGPGRVQAWVTGCGGGATAAEALAQCLADDVPVVVDADALSVLPAILGSATVLTPHAGELAAMLGVSREEVEARRLASVRRAAAERGCVVVLKGRRTLIADRNGRVCANTSGTPWLASAGAGDVLAGLIGSLLAAGLPAYDAACAGVWLHGAAASRVGGPLRTRELGAAVRGVIADLAGERARESSPFAAPLRD